MSSTATSSLHVTSLATVVTSSHSTLSHTDHWSAWKLYKLNELHRCLWITLSQIHSCLTNTSACSLWPTFVHHMMSILIDQITNFNLVLANTASAPLHTSQTNCPPLMHWSVDVSRAYRTPRNYSRTEHPQSWPRSSGLQTHTISRPIVDNPSIDAEFHASLNPVYQFEPMCFSPSRWLSFDSLHAYVVAPPSAEWDLPADSSSIFNMTPW
jgi:hypothetical protein